MRRNAWILYAVWIVFPEAAAARQLARPVADSAGADGVFELGAVEVVVDRNGRTPGTVSVDAATLQAHGRRDLGQALELLPGVAASGFGARNEAMVMVRGFDLRQVPIFMDGVPVYVPYDGYVDLGRFTTYDAAEVRLSRGFSSVLYGPNAMGGAINILSRQPTRALELQAGTGTFTGRGREVYANAGGRLGAAYVQASGSLLEQDRIQLSGAEIRDNSDRRDGRVSLKVGWSPDERREIAVGVATQQGRKGVPPYAGTDPREMRRYWRWPVWNKSGVNVVGRAPLGSRASVLGRAYYDTFDNTLRSFDDDTYIAQTRGSSFNSYYDDYTIGASIEAGLEPAGTHRPRLAIHVKDDTHRENNAGEPVRTFRDRTLSAGLEHVWQPKEATSVVVGASLERRETLRAENLASGAVAPFPVASGTSVNPQIGWFQSVGSGTVRATVSRKTRFPTIKDRYSYRMGQAIPNPDLGSESATHFELGYSGYWRGTTLEVGAFDAEIDDLIQRVDSVSQSASGAYLWQFQNVGRARRRGMDVSLAGQPVAGLTLGGSYSLLAHENLANPDIRLTGTPKHRGFGYVQADPMPWLGVLTSVDAYGMRYGTSGGFELEGYTTVDARVTLRPRAGLEFGVGASNLFDRRFELTPGFPESGRTLSVTLSYAFREGSE